jgi:hypothetical protein
MKPDIYRKLNAWEVWTNGVKLIVTGMPAMDDDEHNCDQMQCGLHHVIVRGSITLLGVAFNSIPQEAADEG